MSSKEITVDKIFNEKIIIKQYKKGYRFSIDSPILADFVYEVAPQPPRGGVFYEERGKGDEEDKGRIKRDGGKHGGLPVQKDQGKIYLEIGAGSGIISILMSFFDRGMDYIKKIYAVELQESLYELARENIEVNDAKNIELINADIKDIKKFIEPNIIDIVFSNPPFFEISTGRVNPNNEKFIARHEVSLNLEKLIKISNYLLKPNGKLKLIYPSDRLSKIITSLNKNSFGLSKLTPVYPKKGDNSRLILIEAIKGKKSIETKILAPIYINKNDNEYSNFVNGILDL